MIKIIDVEIWGLIDDVKTNQKAIVGYPVYVEVEAAETNWLYLSQINNSWLNIKNNYVDWNAVKNL